MKKEVKFKKKYNAEEKRHDKIIKKETNKHEKKHLKEIEVAENIGKAEANMKRKKKRKAK